MSDVTVGISTDMFCSCVVLTIGKNFGCTRILELNPKLELLANVFVSTNASSRHYFSKTPGSGRRIKSAKTPRELSGFGDQWCPHSPATATGMPERSVILTSSQVVGRYQASTGVALVGPRNGQTPGFALAKGLIRGLTRCPNPPT